MKNIVVKDKIINITGISDDDYVSLTDIARLKTDGETNSVITNWMRRVDTLEYLKLWERINNANFKPIDFEGFKSKPGENAFIISPKKWIELTNAIGIRVKSGKNGGTFAHRDIALEFASWISPEIKLYIIKEFQRLKLEENEQLEWQGNRLLSKINYLIQTDTIKNYLLPVTLSEAQKTYVYASEADLLNVALFGMRAKEWRDQNPENKGNIRDHSSAIELAILSNLEYHNSLLIKQGVSQKERLIIMNEEANNQKELFNKNNTKLVEHKTL